MTTAVSTPVWAPWTSFYDPTGQGPSRVGIVDSSNLAVTFELAPLTLSLSGGQGAPLAGATGLAGALSVDLPAGFAIRGFLLVVTAYVDKTAGSEAVVSCSIGHGTQTLQWPFGTGATIASRADGRPDRRRSPAAPRPDGPGSPANPTEDPEPDEEHDLECFTSDSNPHNAGGPLPALPITLSTQARLRTPDEFIEITFVRFNVALLSSL